jgi:hypothetical protein
MKVKELIDILEEQDPDADVLIMSQQSWPFENGVYGVTVRSEMDGGDDDDDDDGDKNENATAATEARDGRATNDVFIVEGSQLRYGSKTAWDVATR